MRHLLASPTWIVGSLITLSVLALPEISMATQASANKAKYAYPEEMVATYVDECSGAGAGKVPANIMKAICTCTIEEFQNTYSLQEFKKIGEAIEQGRTKDIPKEMGKITEDCVKEVLTSKPNV